MSRKTWILGVCALGLILGSVAPEVRAADCAVGGFVVNKRQGILSQLFAFTTNGTFFITYAGAITTGTSGCSNSGIIKREVEQEVFVTANFDALSNDLAKGQGPQLAALSSLMGCTTGQSEEFGRVAQANFDRLAFEGPQQAGLLLAELKSEMRVHPSLSQCSRLT